MRDLLERIQEAEQFQKIRNNKELKKIQEDKADKISKLLEADSGYALASSFSKALDDIVSGKRDSTEVVKEYTDKIDAAVKAGNSSQMINQIKQMLPKINDVGLIAAFQADVSQMMKSAESKNEQEPKGKKGKTTSPDDAEKGAEPSDTLSDNGDGEEENDMEMDNEDEFFSEEDKSDTQLRNAVNNYLKKMSPPRLSVAISAVAKKYGVSASKISNLFKSRIEKGNKLQAANSTEELVEESLLSSVLKRYRNE